MPFLLQVLQLENPKNRAGSLQEAAEWPPPHWDACRACSSAIKHLSWGKVSQMDQGWTVLLPQQASIEQEHNAVGQQEKFLLEFPCKFLPLCTRSSTGARGEDPPLPANAGAPQTLCGKSESLPGDMRPWAQVFRLQ